MAIVLAAPDGGERLYADRIFAVEWTDVPGHTVSMFLSKDNGASFDATPFVTGLNAVSGSNSYNWTPTSADLSDQAKVKVVNDANPGTDFATSANSFTIREVSLSVIAPSGTANPNGVHLDGVVNIVWDDTASEANDVKIELSVNGGSSYTIVIAASTPNTGQYIWTPTSSTSVSTHASCKLRITSLLAGDDLNFNVTGSAFAITGTDILGYPSGKDFPERYDLMARSGIEKAERDDEAVARGQLEEGQNITITKKGETNAADRYNMVIATDRAIPRMLVGEVLCNAAVGDGYDVGTGKYGDHLSGTITHNWALADKEALMVELINIKETGGQALEGCIVPQVEFLSSNAIVVHVIDKDAPVSNVPRDDVQVEQSVKFKYKLIEIV